MCWFFLFVCVILSAFMNIMFTGQADCCDLSDYGQKQLSCETEEKGKGLPTIWFQMTSGALKRNP